MSDQSDLIRRCAREARDCEGRRVMPETTRAAIVDQAIAAAQPAAFYVIASAHPGDEKLCAEHLDKTIRAAVDRALALVVEGLPVPYEVDEGVLDYKRRVERMLRGER